MPPRECAADDCPVRLTVASDGRACTFCAEHCKVAECDAPRHVVAHMRADNEKLRAELAAAKEKERAAAAGGGSDDDGQDTSVRPIPRPTRDLFSALEDGVRRIYRLLGVERESGYGLRSFSSILRLMAGRPAEMIAACLTRNGRGNLSLTSSFSWKDPEIPDSLRKVRASGSSGAALAEFLDAGAAAALLELARSVDSLRLSWVDGRRSATDHNLVFISKNGQAQPAFVRAWAAEFSLGTGLPEEPTLSDVYLQGPQNVLWWGASFFHLFSSAPSTAPGQYVALLRAHEAAAVSRHRKEFVSCAEAERSAAAAKRDAALARRLDALAAPSKVARIGPGRYGDVGRGGPGGGHGSVDRRDTSVWVAPPLGTSGDVDGSGRSASSQTSLSSENPFSPGRVDLSSTPGVGGSGRGGRGDRGARAKRGKDRRGPGRS